MNRIIIVFFALISLGGCSTFRVFPLTANYQQEPVITKSITGIPGDEVWTRVVRFFADHNLPIKTIDKSSGFIQSDMVSFVKAYEIDSDSAHSDVPPYVIAQRETAYHVTIQPSYITGYLKIFVLPDKNSTQVRITIEDLRSYHMQNVHHKHAPVTHDEITRQVYSTSVLENQIGEYINTGIDTTRINIQKGEILNPKGNYSEYIQRQNNRYLGGLIGGGVGIAAATFVALMIVNHPSH